MMDIKELTSKAFSILKSCKAVTLAVETGKTFSFPHILTVIHSIDFDKIILSSNSDFINSIPSNVKAKLSYSDGHDIVTLIGEPEIIRDYESDSTSSHTVLLKFRSEEAAISIAGDCVFLDTCPRFV